MKFALVEGQRHVATKGAGGMCPVCAAPVIARCGEIRVEHWAHRRKADCDPWWENETELYRTWKNRFPDDWQERPHYASDGEKHVADVATPFGWTLEFQRSPIETVERRAREAFYGKLAWVVDGTRRTRDKEQFLRAWGEAVAIARNSPVRKVLRGNCALLRDWDGSAAHVFFDFGDEQDLYWLMPVPSDFYLYVVSIHRADFVDSHRKALSPTHAVFDRLAATLIAHIMGPEPRRRPQAGAPQLRYTMPPSREHVRWMRAQRNRRL